ncbi:hypothetical protein WJ438_00335 [Streptomyces sp. GD-15H]|uniref:hypothetical protein n=1 Tax=Streptomyces sp. GD-15H TaxID=3129112 RepID=UPI0032548102
MRMLLHDLLTADLDDSTEWNALTHRLREVLPQLADAPLPAPHRLNEALCHVPQPVTPVAPVANDAATIMSVATSIQRAKGETHAATLILECLDSRGRKYDVHETLALVATSKDVAEATPTLRKAAQLLFVGITRPTHLLALAAHRARVEPHLDALKARGWLIRSVASHM